MGGGAAMRAAAKVAKINAANGGLRGFAPEASVTSVARQAAFRSSSVAEDTTKLGITASPNANIEQSFQAAPAWDLDDWEFEGEEFVADKVSTSPRLVFGSVPSIEEAKEATDDLREALDKMYFSTPMSAGSEDSFAISQELSETKTCVTSEASIVPSVPNRAFQAFKLLRESPAVQGVVASVASDPNIWNAIMQNEAFLEYCKSGESSVECEEPLVVNSREDSIDGTEPSKPENIPVDFIENVKMTVMGMVNNFTDFVQYLFGGSAKKTAPESAEGFPGVMAIGGSLMGLVVMVIMVVALKRA